MFCMYLVLQLGCVGCYIAPIVVGIGELAPSLESGGGSDERFTSKGDERLVDLYLPQTSSREINAAPCSHGMVSIFLLRLFPFSTTS